MHEQRPSEANEDQPEEMNQPNIIYNESEMEEEGEMTD